MTNPRYTHITLVCDRSGSMQSIRSDAEGAVNAFIEEQKRQPGECTLYLVDFDAVNTLGGRGGHDSDPLHSSWYRTHFDGHIDQATKYTLMPRGSTALYDAIGRAIGKTGERLAALPEERRPGAVIFVVQTDGMENSSREWTQDAVREAIMVHTTTYSWDFVFLGTGPASWGQGQQLGFQNVARAAAGPQAYQGTYSNLSHTVNSRRAGNVDAMAGMNIAVDETGKVTADEP